MATTSHRSLRLWSRPVGYASRSCTNAPSVKLFTITPIVKTQSLFDSASAPRNQR